MGQGDVSGPKAALQLAVLRIPVEPAFPNTDTPLMDAESSSGRPGWLCMRIESKVKAARVGTADYDLLQGGAVIRVRGESVDRITTIILKVMKAEGWRGKAYLTKRYGPSGSRKASYVIRPWGPPKRIG